MNVEIIDDSRPAQDRRPRVGVGIIRPQHNPEIHEDEDEDD